MRIRKNIRDLTTGEVLSLRRAFAAMYSDKQKRYQAFSKILLNNGHATRNDLDFLTWNRAFFHALENLLVEFAPDLALPYWDYTAPESIASGLPAILTEQVYTDPDTNETLPNPLFCGVGFIKMITYRETKPPAELAITVAIAQKAMEQTDYQNFLTTYYEADVVSHVWIGGSMTDLHAAPFDPLFWFSHCNLDRYWNKWQQQFPDLGVSTMIPTVLNANLKPFKNGDNAMKGTDVINISDMGYTYA